jgi:3-hydroxybutyryl-CoA dehydrogenase
MRFLCKKYYMRIVLMATQDQEDELTAQGRPSGADELICIRDSSDAIDINDADGYIDLRFDESSDRLHQLQQLKSGLIIINSVMRPLNNSTDSFVRINGWSTFLSGPLIEASCQDNNNKQKTEDIFTCFKKKVEWVPDIPGFIVPRVISSIINEAYFTLQERVSSKEEIDTAMKLGTNYPYGPFEWSKKIGLKKIHELLSSLARDEKRYEPASLLTKESGV